MAASADTLSQPRQGHDQWAPQRSKRAVPSPGPALASMRTSFSQLSTNDDHKSQHSQHSTAATPSPREGRVESAHTRSARSLAGPNGSNHESKPSLPPLQIPYSKQRAGGGGGQGPQAEAGIGDSDNGYFGDILDKYCNSDEDPTSASTASPTSPFSTAQSWADFSSAQPPTPPVTSSRHLRNQPQAAVPPRRATPLRNSSTAAPSVDSSKENSPVLAASTRFNAYLQSSSNRSSQDSFSPHGPNSAAISTSSSPSIPTMRAYAKRPVPAPVAGSGAATPSPRAPAVSTAASPDSRDFKPEPPPRDSSRQLLRSQQQSTSGSKQPQQLNTLPSAVEETMKRSRTASVTSPVSSPSSANPYAENAIRDRSNSNHSQLSYLPGNPRDRHSAQQQQQHNLYYQGQKDTTSPTSRSQGHEEQQRYQQRQQQPQQQQQHDLYHQGQKDATSPTSRSQGHEEQQRYQQWQQQPQQQHDQRQSTIESHSYQTQRSSHHPSSPLTPSEMLSRRFEGRSHILGKGAIPAVSKHTGTSGMKSALVKTPIARARAKEIDGPRKVIFGDTITIVTVERADTPPPLPPVDKKKKKAKKGSSKAGPHPDPEYDPDYYNAPYTPEPAEVVVTQAPWIGNPNYDEEKANSKFYEDDYDYEYDDYEYETTSHDIRLGPDEDDEDDDEDDDDEDEYGNGSRAFGNGITGGASSPKKKGGIFKRAVNRLLRN